jgi:hypothetical protein
MLKRRSRLAPPSWRVFEALVDELDSWWVPVEDERAPHVVRSERPHIVTYSSPCLRRPSDGVAFQFDLGTDGYGCALTVDVQTVEPFVPSEAVTLRHRWGEHLDHALRKWLDDGWPVGTYRVSAYRTEVVAWAALELLKEGQLWRVTEDVWVRVVPDRRFAFQREVGGGGSHDQVEDPVVVGPASSERPFRRRVVGEEVRSSTPGEGVGEQMQFVDQTVSD